MIGGGPGSFIGPIHRIAADMDGLTELVSGCFSSSHEKSLELGKELGLDLSRVYATYEEMLEKESKISSENKIDFVAILTPNNLHFPQTQLSLKYGFHVLLDKPMCMDLKEALELEKAVKESGKLFCLAHTYTGYPMVKEARQIVKEGKLGKIRKVHIDYPQGWLSRKLEDTNHKQAGWRTDPKQSGKAGSLGDIGTHAFNLAEYVSGLKVSEICAEISTFVEGRLLDDDAAVLVKFEGGAKGVIKSSQILSGEENSLIIRVWGENGGIEWCQRDCNTVLLKWLDKPTEILRAGTGYKYLSKVTRAHCRLPGGHPEGYIEAFANIYRNFAIDLLKLSTDKETYDYPGIEEGVRGMTYIERCLESSVSDKKWTKF